MLIFDEMQYAKNILENKKYSTIKTQGRERCVLVRYLKYLGESDDSIKETLSLIPMSGGEYLSDKDKDVIYSKIINKALDYEFVHNKEVIIYQSEIDVINSIEDKNAKNLLFVYLVYYKWAIDIFHLSFHSKKNDIMMAVEDNSNIWKLSELSKLRVAERYRLCNSLFNLGLYKLDNFKSHNYMYIPFVKNSGDIAFTIKDYRNILGELNIYIEPTKYKRCAICGLVFPATRSPKKYCNECAYNENIRKTKENKKSLKTQSSQTPVITE